MMYFVYYVILIVAVFVVILYMINKNLRTKENLINQLKSQINDQHEKNNKLLQLSNTNRRRDHRVEVYNTQAEVFISSTEDNRFQKVVGKKFVGTMSDISHSGTKILSDYSFPIQGRFKVTVNFSLLEENFSFNAFMIRKEEHLNEKEVSYGFQFINVSNRMEQKLAFILHKIEAERRKKIS